MSALPKQLATRAEGRVLGIDVGWSEKDDTSAVCRLSWSKHRVYWKTKRFRATPSDRERAIRDVAGKRALLAVAIDGPLRRGFDRIGRYRSAERLLSRGALPVRIGKPGQSSSPHGKHLNEQANKAASVVKRYCSVHEARHAVRIDKYAIVEAFPTTFFGSMVEDPGRLLGSGARSDRYFAHLANVGTLDRLMRKWLGRRHCVREPCDIDDHEDRAAFVCALTALAVAAGEFTAVGDDRDGWIILPPRWAWAAWAWAGVERVARDEVIERGSASGRLVVEPIEGGRMK